MFLRLQLLLFLWYYYLYQRGVYVELTTKQVCMNVKIAVTVFSRLLKRIYLVHTLQLNDDLNALNANIKHGVKENKKSFEKCSFYIVCCHTTMRNTNLKSLHLFKYCVFDRADIFKIITLCFKISFDYMLHFFKIEYIIYK